MPDPLTPERRSELMRSVRTKHTRPEIEVRKTVRALGRRYRLHVNDLPGRPDLVFLGSKKVIFVHGCFWHAHHGCKKSSIPKTRPEFWAIKLTENTNRDKRNEASLYALGWESLVVWECELANPAQLKEKIRHYLNISGID